MLSWAISLFERPSLWDHTSLSPCTRRGVATSRPSHCVLEGAIEPLVHAPQAVQSARVRGIKTASVENGNGGSDKCGGVPMGSLITAPGGGARGGGSPR